jgi:hypothetical protein
MGVWMGNTLEWCAVDVADSDGVPVYFIEHNASLAPGVVSRRGAQRLSRQPRALAS